MRHDELPVTMADVLRAAERSAMEGAARHAASYAPWVVKAPEDGEYRVMSRDILEEAAAQQAALAEARQRVTEALQQVEAAQREVAQAVQAARDVAAAVPGQVAEAQRAAEAAMSEAAAAVASVLGESQTREEELAAQRRELLAEIAKAQGSAASEVAQERRARVEAIDAALQQVARERDEAVQRALEGSNLAELAAAGGVHVGPAAPDKVVEGKLWMRTVSGSVVQVQVYRSGRWTDVRLVASEVLVPGSVGTVSIREGAITAPKIQASQALVDKLVTPSLMAGKIDSGMIRADQALVDKLVTPDLMAGKITGGMITADTVLTQKLSAAGVWADEVEGKTLTGGVVRTASSGQRVEMDSGGIKLYDGAGVVRAQMRPGGTSLEIRDPAGTMVPLSTSAFGSFSWKGNSVWMPGPGSRARGVWGTQRTVTLGNMLTGSGRAMLHLHAIFPGHWSGGVHAAIRLVSPTNAWTRSAEWRMWMPNGGERTSMGGSRMLDSVPKLTTVEVQLLVTCFMEPGSTGNNPALELVDVIVSPA